MQAVWSGMIVSDSAIFKAIRELRSVLAELNPDEEFIRTQTRRGYMWLVTPETSSSEETSSRRKPMSTRPGRFKIPAISSVVLAIIAIVFILIYNKQELQQSSNFKAGLHRMAVIPFINSTGETRMDWVQLGLMDMFIQMTKDTQTIDILPTKEVLAFTRNQWPRPPEEIEPYELICSSLGCDAITRVEVFRKDQGYQLVAETFSNGSLIVTETETNNDVLDALSELIIKLTEKIAFGNPGLPDFHHHYTSDKLANGAYVMGLQAMEMGEYQAASQFFDTSLLKEPGFYRATIKKAVSFEKQGMYPEARESLEKIDSKSLADLPLSLQVDLLNLKADLEYAEGDLRASIELSLKLLPMAEKISDDYEIGRQLHNIGHTYTALGELDSAESNLAESLKTFEYLGYTPGIARASFNLANVYLDRQENEKAVPLFKKARSLFNITGNKLYSLYADWTLFTYDKNTSLLDKTERLESFVMKANNLKDDFVLAYARFEQIRMYLQSGNMELVDKLIAAVNDIELVNNNGLLLDVLRLLKARVNIHKGQLDKAANLLEKPVDWNINELNDGRRLRLLAHIDYLNGQYDAALKKLEAIEQNNPPWWAAENLTEEVSAFREAANNSKPSSLYKLP